MHVYEVRPRYDTPDNAIGYAMHRSRSHPAVIRVYDAGGNVIETHNKAAISDPTKYNSHKSIPCIKIRRHLAKSQDCLKKQRNNR
jgi:hypothetical protein